MSIKILAIESSCDDTSAALMQDASVLSLGVYNQKIHQKYGGVVPELASRAHQQQIVPTVTHTLQEAGVDKSELDAIACTVGPGLLGSLLVGCSFSKAFASAANIPLIAVNHMEAHILAHMIDEPRPPFPFICLTVSGGHTQLVIVHSPLEMEVIGETIDDAAGEAFDKTGKMLQLDYPAGPIIDKYAAKGEAIYTFPTPKVDTFQFSFSGLKTAIRNFLIKSIKTNENFIEEQVYNICASVQHSIVSILIDKLRIAAETHNIQDIAIAGGVSANSGLRQALQDLCREQKWNAYIPAFKYCTDNAAMIGIAAYYKYLNKDFVDQHLTPQPRLKI